MQTGYTPNYQKTFNKKKIRKNLEMTYSPKHLQHGNCYHRSLKKIETKISLETNLSTS